MGECVPANCATWSHRLARRPRCHLDPRPSARRRQGRVTPSSSNETDSAMSYSRSTPPMALNAFREMPKTCAYTTAEPLGATSAPPPLMGGERLFLDARACQLHSSDDVWLVHCHRATATPEGPMPGRRSASKVRRCRARPRPVWVDRAAERPDPRRFAVRGATHPRRVHRTHRVPPQARDSRPAFGRRSPLAERTALARLRRRGPRRDRGALGGLASDLRGAAQGAVADPGTRAREPHGHLQLDEAELERDRVGGPQRARLFGEGAQ